MIKEWHKECKGRGFVERGSYGVLHVSCDGCQGKGYTELEPIFNSKFKKKDHELMKEFFTGYEDEKISIYLKFKGVKSE